MKSTKPRNWRKRYPGEVPLTNVTRQWPMSRDQLAAQAEAYRYKMLGVGDDFLSHTLNGKVNGAWLRTTFRL